MDDRGKSDGPVVPAKLPNNAQGGAAEVVEGRGSAEGNAARETRAGLRAGVGVSSDLDRVRRMARKGKDARFTALLHHVDVDRLRAAYLALRPKAAAGVDGVTWADYGLGLEANLRDLHARVHRGGYRAKPSRRVFIAKPDGRQRPLGVAALVAATPTTTSRSRPVWGPLACRERFLARLGRVRVWASAGGALERPVRRSNMAGCCGG